MYLEHHLVRLPELTALFDLQNGHVTLTPRRLSEAGSCVRLTLAEVEAALRRAMVEKLLEGKEA